MALVVPAVSGAEFAEVLYLVGFHLRGRNLAFARLESDERLLTVPLVPELRAEDFRHLLLAAKLTATEFLELLSCVQRKPAG